MMYIKFQDIDPSASKKISKGFYQNGRGSHLSHGLEIIMHKWIFYHSLLSLVVCIRHILSPAVPTPLKTAGLCRVCRVTFS